MVASSRKVALLIGLLCGMALAHGAEVYKWKDTDGQIRYTDQPPPGKVPYQTLSPKKPAAAAPVAGGQAPSDSAAGDRNGGDRQKQALSEEQKKRELQKLDDQKIREQNCANARSNMVNYKIGGRMYKIDEKGERVYLSDADISKGLENANRDVKQWCDE